MSLQTLQTQSLVLLLRLLQLVQINSIQSKLVTLQRPPRQPGLRACGKARLGSPAASAVPSGSLSARDQGRTEAAARELGDRPPYPRKIVRPPEAGLLNVVRGKLLWGVLAPRSCKSTSHPTPPPPRSQA